MTTVLVLKIETIVVWLAGVPVYPCSISGICPDPSFVIGTRGVHLTKSNPAVADIVVGEECSHGSSISRRAEVSKLRERSKLHTASIGVCPFNQDSRIRRNSITDLWLR